MDPITNAIVAAIAAGAAGVAGQVPLEAGKLMVKDAYDALKTTLRKKFGPNGGVEKAVTALEKEPDFKPNQDMLVGRMEQVRATEDKELLRLAEVLVEALKNTDQGRNALETKNIKIEKSQVGVIGDNANISGGIHMGEEKK